MVQYLEGNSRMNEWRKAGEETNQSYRPISCRWTGVPRFPEQLEEQQCIDHMKFQNSEEKQNILKTSTDF